MTERYLSVTEVAIELGVVPGTVKGYITRGTFPEPDVFIGDIRGWALPTINEYKATRNPANVRAGRRTRDA